MAADHTAPVVPAKIDPTTFYNNFKAADDKTQRAMVDSLASMPKGGADFIRQVAEVGRTSDRAAAPAVLNDLKDTVKAVRSDNPTVAPAVVAVVADRSVKGVDSQPAVVPGKIADPTPVIVNLGDRGNKPTGPGDVGIQVNRPVPDVKVTTSVDGIVLRDGGRGQMPGGDSFKPDGKDRGVPGQQIDPNILLARGLDGKGQIPGQIPVDRLPFTPGKPIQLPDAVLRGHQPGDGKDNPLGPIVARGRDGGDQPQALTPPQRNLIPGLDLNDPQTRAFLADALKQMQATKVGDFDPRNQHQTLQDILKGFDPNKVDKLQAFLNPDGKGPINDAAVGKLASILTQSAERVTGSAATDLTLAQKTSIDRVTELIKGNQNLIDLTTLQTKDARLLQEINRLVGDVNKQFGLDGKNALTLGDIIGRSLDGTKGGERGLGLEGKSPLDRALGLDPLSFTAKMTPAQDQAIRAILDAREHRLPGELVGKLDPKGEIARQENAASIASRIADLTGKNEHGKTESGIRTEKPDQLGVKPEGKPELAGKPELSAKELGSRPELGTKAELSTKAELAGKQETVKSDQIVRADIKDERTDKSDPLAPFAKHDATQTNLDGTKKQIEEKDNLVAKHKDDQERLEEEQQRREAALLALVAERKLREDKEMQQKEQERLQEKKKDEDTRRRRYVVRERDTLESIATKQHRDAKLAPLIYELNRKEIALKLENGEQGVDLRPRQVIWVASGVDIKES